MDSYKRISRNEFESLKNEIQQKFARIEILDDSNIFENDEILHLKAEIESSIFHLDQIIKKQKIQESSLRLI